LSIAHPIASERRSSQPASPDPRACLRERLHRIAPRALESLGLTRRQAEVLGWLVDGKANLQIAAILAISPSTVARHVEAIFERVGVQTRTAAAAAAFNHLSSS
jgi:DNA-binding CsgD family transcriptional regulator